MVHGIFREYLSIYAFHNHLFQLVHLKKRSKKNDNTFNYKEHLPYYLIIIDDYKNVENLEVINELLKSDKNMGFSILFLTDSILKLPTECKNFIEISGKCSL